MNTNLNRQAKSADIALLLEGTFPYVSGGVSSWVNQMIRSFPEITFAVVFIGSRRQDYGKPRYELPDNVVHFEEHYIHESSAPTLVRASEGNRPAFERVAAMHDSFRNDKSLGAIGKLMREIIPMMADGGAISEQQFLNSKSSWDSITENYEKFCTDPSFTDYFWTIRIMHKPLWQLARISENLIPVKMYHTVSTGYAGFLGALLRFRTARPLLVSEHGIYTKERKIDLLQSEWIRDNRGLFEKDISQVSYFQDLWVRFFEVMGKVCYEAADDIVSLYEANRRRQHRDGAPEEKTQCIPNGIDVSRFAALRAQRAASVPPVVALIGRVVPIKDIKTFIRAIFIVSRKLPAVQGWIVGPETEDPEYVRECHELVSSLGVGSNLKFLGFRKVDELLPEIGLVALSSISEALPLVVLEAFAAGVPVVTTDVGSCRELIEGVDADDKALGSAGSVVQIASPEHLAKAMLELFENTDMWQAAQQTGIARVERYYTDVRMKDSYRKIYESLMSSQTVESAQGDQ
ncbi:GT4 family glycosyltransferase PelF [Eoetvoesiella caeni]|uniref:Glycosyltransferase involved in cell wall biosynthesis n=1 Tax=Eoetvoesiella caeni TaxID=645616 RepID=A0A366H3G3_9BURK|nr:GT4 family glycosyltransferase PelF [Eoetvoesiella caeni]MCI2810884.1 GT4 family glycosyltransferase PelF [Eoetvoesiella caeni]NYT56817.1 GT4 family glycosyltransferase PelF [Eoetvoesiella caeni]RBP35615.1 glycosyltransferase involved in cell wall biosynthesis [Eoetvoesiella caeni]